MDNTRKRPATRTRAAERTSKPEEPVDLGVEAAAKLKLLQRAAHNFVARLPSVDEWATFLRAEIIPVYNAFMPSAPMCLECGKRMQQKKPPRHVCSPDCASAYTARTRKPGSKVTTVRPHEPGETAKVSMDELVASHKRHHGAK
jgi:hypothetical protein